MTPRLLPLRFIPPELNGDVPKMIEALGDFLIEPTIERKNTVLILMNMYRYWDEKEVNR